MSSDTDFLKGGNGSDSGAAIDPSYAEMYKGYDETKEADLKVGTPPITRSDYYFVEVTEVDGRKMPFQGPAQFEGNVTFTVVEGPAETPAGRKIRGSKSMQFGQRATEVQGKFRDLTDEEKTAWREEHKRFVSKLGLRKPFPSSPGEAAIKEWLSPALGKKFILTAYPDKNGFSRVVWNSLRLPDDEAHDPSTSKPIAGKTALQQAREELSKAPKQKGAAKGKTAASLATGGEL